MGCLINLVALLILLSIAIFWLVVAVAVVFGSGYAALELGWEGLGIIVGALVIVIPIGLLLSGLRDRYDEWNHKRHFRGIRTFDGDESHSVLPRATGYVLPRAMTQVLTRDNGRQLVARLGAITFWIVAAVAVAAVIALGGISAGLGGGFAAKALGWGGEIGILVGLGTMVVLLTAILNRLDDRKTKKRWRRDDDNAR